MIFASVPKKSVIFRIYALLSEIITKIGVDLEIIL